MHGSGHSLRSRPGSPGSLCLGSSILWPRRGRRLDHPAFGRAPRCHHRYAKLTITERSRKGAELIEAARHDPRAKHVGHQA